MPYHLDWETYSDIDLKAVGAARYGEDHSTEILMGSISHNGDGPYLFINPKHGESDPKAVRMFKDMARSEEEIYAWNSTFEWFVAKHRWKKDVALGDCPRMERFRCVQALSRVAGLPNALDQAAQLCLPKELHKDKDGGRLIKIFSMRQKDGRRILPADRPNAFRKFGRYCLQDNEAEVAMFQKLEPFKFRGDMVNNWRFDQRLNDRGFPVNVRALKHALKLVTEASVDLVARFRKLSGGINPSQRAKVKLLLSKLGLDMVNMQALTVQETLESFEDRKKSPAFRILELYSEIQFSAVAKIRVMLECVCRDGFARGMFMFYGASTGRWSGKLIQPQNFRKSTIGDTAVAYSMLCQGCTIKALRLVFGNPLEAIASCIRNFIQWEDGTLLDADYASIEARILCWLAGQEDALERFRRNEDQYVAMAAFIYGIDKKAVTKDQREVGKRTVLGCGFSMAAGAFKRSCWKQYRLLVSMELAEKAVAGYRAMHPKVRKLWYACDSAARAAVAKPGNVFAVGEHVKFWVHTYQGIPYLLMRLPSGRKLAYPWPQMALESGKDRPAITFYGHIKGKHWGRVKTYGGKLVENATQGTAFDVMAYGACNAEEEGFRIISVIHDQAPALHLPHQKLSNYVAALTRLPEWAKRLPIKAEGKEIPYYRK